jgi:hypothetical protein
MRLIFLKNAKIKNCQGGHMNFEYFINRVSVNLWVIPLFTIMFSIVLWIFPLVVGTRISRIFIKKHIRYYTLIPILPFFFSVLFAYSVQAPMDVNHINFCNGLPLKRTATYKQGVGVHPTFLADAKTGKALMFVDGFFQDFVYTGLPEASNPKNIYDVQLVACFSLINETKKGCGGYTPGGNPFGTGFKYYIISHDFEIKLIAAKTGNLIQTIEVKGNKPNLCPNSIPASKADQTEYIVPSEKSVQDALLPFIYETNSIK